MMNKKLSIVVPVYNVIRYLKECVASVRKQQYDNYELILVDDGSTDGSGELCDRLAADDPARIRVIHKANAGLGMARNTGIDAATGHYIAFIDSDDTIHPEAYRVSIEAMEQHDADIVRFGYHSVTDGTPADSGNVTGAPAVYDSPEQLPHFAKATFGQPFAGDNEFDPGGSAWNAVYRLDTINDNNLRFVSERDLISEDYIFSYQYYLLSKSLVVFPREYYNYRVVPGSVSRSNHLGKMERVENYCRYVSGMLRRDGFSPRDDRYAQGFCVMMIRATLKYVLSDKSLPAAEKRAWFDRYVRGGYFREICDTFPTENMTLPQRLIHKALCRGSYHQASLMARLARTLKG